jgi:putative hydrolase of the HAD superfamily
MLRRIRWQSRFTNATQELRPARARRAGHRRPFLRRRRARHGYASKPDPHAYRRILDAIGARPEECIIVEDTPRNLLPAKAMGMKTILVDHQDCDDVDYCVSDILKVGDVVADARG